MWGIPVTVVDTLANILALTPSTAAVGSLARPTDVQGCTLEMSASGWVGCLGVFASDAVMATATGGNYANLAAGGVTVNVVGTQRAYIGGTKFTAAASQFISTVCVDSISHSKLAGAPLVVSTDSVTAALGPTTSSTSTPEYSALKLHAIETAYTNGSSIVKNPPSFFSGMGLQYSPRDSVNVLSSPVLQANGTVNWMNRGGIIFYADGEGSITISTRGNNTPITMKVTVDGCRLPESDTSGTLHSDVTVPTNSLQWVTLSLTNDKRRLIRVFGGFYSIVYSPAISISSWDPVGNAIVFGDSVAGRLGAQGEVGATAQSLSATSLELMGWNVIDATTGGTGFINNGGGISANKGNYSDYIDAYVNQASIHGFDLSGISLVWLFGSGNDAGISNASQYMSVINKALSAFPNATICVTSVYEGFNTALVARNLNDLLYAAVKSFASRVVWVPIDSYYKYDGFGIFSGTGSVPNPKYDGNADVYFSNAVQGAADRHPNTNGVIYGAKYLASELIRAGIPYKRPE